jgi:DNA polymerase III sliding clamp (beta) subunit (PCNA family)
MFNVKTDTKQLNEAISFVLGAVPSKPDAPIFGTIFLEVLEDQKLKLRATNGEVDRVFLMETEGAEADETCCIDPIIASIIQSFSSDEVTLVKEENKIKVSSGPKSHNINFIAGSEYPEGRPSVGDYSKVDHSVFFSALNRAGIAVSEVTHDLLQTCFAIGVEPDTIAATDGYQIVIVNDLPLPVGHASLPPAKQLVGLAKLTEPNKEEEFFVSIGTNLGLKTDRWEIRIKGVSGEFPPVSEVILAHKDMSPILEVRLDRVSFLRNLEVCQIYASRASSLGFADHTTFTKSKDGVTLAMSVSGVASFTEPVEILEYLEETTDFTILFSSARTIEAIRQMESEVITVTFFQSDSPFLITETMLVSESGELAEKPGFVYLEVPLQV